MHVPSVPCRNLPTIASRAERGFLDPEGLPGRKWFRHVLQVVPPPLPPPPSKRKLLSRRTLLEYRTAFSLLSRRVLSRFYPDLSPARGSTAPYRTMVGAGAGPIPRLRSRPLSRHLPGDPRRQHGPCAAASQCRRGPRAGRSCRAECLEAQHGARWQQLQRWGRAAHFRPGRMKRRWCCFLEATIVRRPGRTCSEAYNAVSSSY